MKKSWSDFHVEPLDDPDDWSDDGSVTENPHKRVIWRGISMTTMYNDEVHGVKNDDQQTRTTEGTFTGT